MARPKLREAENFPERFLITSYDECASWGMWKWFIALKRRRSLLWNIAAHPHDERVKESINKLIEHPLILEEEYITLSLEPIMNQSITDFFAGYMFCDETEEGRQYALWNKALDEAERNIDLFETMRTGVETDIDIFTLLELQNYPAWKMHNEIRNQNRQPLNDRYFISVDLKTTDDQLEKAFKNWITEMRKEIGSPERIKITKETLSEWHKKRYLPLIDVNLWSWIYGDVTYAQYGKRIFEDGDDANTAEPENIRKTTLKNAMKLISDDFVYSLGRLVNHPTPSKSRKSSKKT